VKESEKMKTFKWVVEFEVTENWVEDGFNLTEDRANDMIANALPYAYGSEYKATVIKSPSAKLIAKIQGEAA
jgi:hypothetical protein